MLALPRGYPSLGGVRRRVLIRLYGFDQLPVIPGLTVTAVTPGHDFSLSEL